MKRAACIIAVVCAVLLGGCGLTGGNEATDATTGKPIDLPATEVREYKGQKLGSVAEFRENSIKGPQQVDIDTYRLKITGMVDEPRSLTYRQVLDRPSFKKVVTLNCIEGWSVRVLWEGVRLTDLLEEADYDRDATTVIFRCEDGYSTSLPLEFIEERDILLAYKMNGMDLPTERGYPFEVVAESRWGYKWARWVTSIEVSDDTDFEGYWESRGYSNDAELP